VGAASSGTGELGQGRAVASSARGRWRRARPGAADGELGSGAWWGLWDLDFSLAMVGIGVRDDRWGPLA
jgi:hypothetical protein